MKKVLLVLLLLVVSCTSFSRTYCVSVIADFTSYITEGTINKAIEKEEIKGAELIFFSAGDKGVAYIIFRDNKPY